LHFSRFLHRQIAQKNSIVFVKNNMLKKFIEMVILAVFQPPNFWVLKSGKIAVFVNFFGMLLFCNFCRHFVTIFYISVLKRNSARCVRSRAVQKVLKIGKNGTF
jgi:hypothetical protein